MPTPRAQKRDPLVPTNAPPKRKREVEDDSTLPPRQTPKRSSSRLSLERNGATIQAAEPPVSTPKKRSSKAAESVTLSKTEATVTKASFLDEADDKIEFAEVGSKKTSAKRTKKVVKTFEEAEAEHESDCGSVKEDEISPKKRKRKTMEEKEAEAMPLAARTTGLRMFVGKDPSEHIFLILFFFLRHVSDDGNYLFHRVSIHA
jgi:glutamyl/glutaminyl-tRNA synthetase